MSDPRYRQETITWPLAKGVAGALIGVAMTWVVGRVLPGVALAPALLVGLFALMGVIDGLGDARARFHAREADRLDLPNPNDDPAEYSWALWSVDRRRPTER